jgi:hypothetical protein
VNGPCLVALVVLVCIGIATWLARSDG